MTTINCKRTGEKIKSMIKQNGYSVKDITAACCVTIPAVYKWFSGNSMPTIDNLIIIANVCKCRIDDLLVVDDI